MKAAIKDMEVKVAVDNMTMGWLSKITGLSVNDILFDLFDMSANVRKRLTKRNGKWCEDNNVPFPKFPTVCFSVRAERVLDWEKFQEDMKVWRERCIAETGHDVWSYSAASWRIHNPEPNKSTYEFVKVTFTVAQSQEVLYSQHHLDTLMTEKFLLGLTEEVEKEENGESR